MQNWTAKDIDHVLLVGGSTRIPLVQETVKKLLGKEPDKGSTRTNASRLVHGIQGAVLTGETKDIVLLDVTPLTLGIETLGGIATKTYRTQHHDPHPERARSSRPQPTARPASRSM